MNDALLSVVIPVYNKGEAIKRGLDSIVDQTYSHWEVEIVDDGSTDQTWKIIEETAEKDRPRRTGRHARSAGSGFRMLRTA